MDALPPTRRGWIRHGVVGGAGETVTTLAGDQVELLLVDLADVQRASPHTHDVEQILVVLEGSVRLHLNGTERDLVSGDAIVIPPNVMHGASSVGTAPARLLEARRFPNTTVGLR
jgi:quercetin dioxygenase-like cupin family protein